MQNSYIDVEWFQGGCRFIVGWL